MFDPNKILVYLAIIGKYTVGPGINPIVLPQHEIDCLISTNYPPSIVDDLCSVNLPTADCTVFTIEHNSYYRNQLDKVEILNEILEKSLIAVSEMLLWFKAKDKAGVISPYVRKVGRSDVKYFLLEAEKKTQVLWQNGSYWTSQKGFQFLSSLLSNMINTNGPAANPLPPTIKRAMSCLDLINLGFYTEAFITGFSLLDDLSQEIVKAGLQKKNITKGAQDNLIRSVTESRLLHFLTDFLKLCDGVSLEDSDPVLFKDLKVINSKRNRIMHGSDNLSRHDSIEYLEIIFGIIEFLRTNKFGYQIPSFPNLKIIDPTYVYPKSIFDGNQQS